MNLKKITILLAFSVLSSSAFAGFLKEGAYLGAHNGVRSQFAGYNR